MSILNLELKTQSLEQISTLSPLPYPLNPSPNLQPCPVCANPIGSCAGTKEAICTNCGYKDPCCD